MEIAYNVLFGLGLIITSALAYLCVGAIKEYRRLRKQYPHIKL